MAMTTMHDLTPIPRTGIALADEVRVNRHGIGEAGVFSPEEFARVSPSHGTVVSPSAKGGPAETAGAIAAARAEFAGWSRLSDKARTAVLLKVADLIEVHVELIARIEMLETGKPIAQARRAVSDAADLWRHAASLARTLHGDSHNTLGPDMLGVALKKPVGLVSVITPWDFPFWVLSQKLPFALAAGCTCVVKPSELAPSTTVMLADFLVQAGLPSGVVNIVLGYGQPVDSLTVSHPSVGMVTFTGSTAVGKSITAAASVTLKKVALELGGKNFQVIFAGADLDSAADAVTFGIHVKAGECCNSGGRIIVPEDIAEAYTARLVALARWVAFGDRLNEATQVGAIVSSAHQVKIDLYVQGAVAAGAKNALGGAPLRVERLPGEFYQPTVAIAREEVFDPILSVLIFCRLEEAIVLANAASYGLSAGVWSENVHTCLEFARHVQAGTIWTNTWMDRFAEMTFRGMKQSGLGREIGSYGLDEFLEVKTVALWVGRTRAKWVRRGRLRAGVADRRTRTEKRGFRTAAARRRSGGFTPPHPRGIFLNR